MSRYFIGFKDQQRSANQIKAPERIEIPTTNKGGFVLFFIQYIFSRIYEFILYIVYSIANAIDKFTFLKNYIVRNMFWGRSSFYKLGTHLFIGIVTLIIGFANISSEISSALSINNDYNADFNSSDDIVNLAGTSNDLAGTYNPVPYIIPSITYEVQAGDTLEKIVRYMVDKDKEFYSQFDETLEVNQQVLDRKKSVLKLINNLSGDNPKITQGQKIVSFNFDGLVLEVQDGDTLDKIATKYNISVDEIKLLNSYWLPENGTIKKGDKLIMTSVYVKEPEKPKPIIKKPTSSGNGTYVGNQPVAYTGSGKFIRPLEQGCGIITQYYKPTHSGVDIAQNGGCKIIAAAEGVVTQAGWTTGGGGYMVTVQHSDGYVTMYCHGSGVFYVKAGDRVQQGQPLLYMGRSGKATGVHLHFMVTINGKSVNPMSVVKL